MSKPVIGGRNLNSGIRGGLWDVKHYRKMRDALWLFGWLVHRQTKERNGTGLVLAGKPLSYADIIADISRETGADNDPPPSERTLQRWMARLIAEGYIEVKHSIYGRMVIRILHAKKFNPKQLELPAIPTLSCPPEVADLKPSPPPNMAEVSPPNMADIHDKNGALKEGTEFEQKHLGRGAANAADPRFQKIIEKYFASMRAQGIEPTFDKSDGQQLATWLKRNPRRAIGDILKTLENAIESSDPYPLRHGFRLREFLAHEAKYQRGPLHRHSREAPEAQQSEAGDEIVKLEVPS